MLSSFSNEFAHQTLYCSVTARRGQQEKKHTRQKIKILQKSNGMKQKDERHIKLTGVIFKDKHHRKKIDWFLNGISRDDFDNNVVFFFGMSNHLFPCSTVSARLYSFVYVSFDRHV